MMNFESVSNSGLKQQTLTATVSRAHLGPSYIKFCKN